VSEIPCIVIAVRSAIVIGVVIEVVGALASVGADSCCDCDRERPDDAGDAVLWPAIDAD
jgi:hypothetical protein